MNRTTRRILISVAGAALAIGAAPVADAALCNGLCAATTGRVHNTGIRPVDQLVDRLGNDLEGIEIHEPGEGDIRVPRIVESDAPTPQELAPVKVGGVAADSAPAG